MISPAELLDHARRLLAGAQPTQADLRRAVSASYYGIFHLFAFTSARRFFPGRGDAFHGRVLRSFDHRTMRDACWAFSAIDRGIPKDLDKLILALGDKRLAVAAQTFVELQEARHRSDYDLLADFTWDEANEAFTSAVVIPALWDEICALEETDVFLVVLLFGNRLLRRG